MQSLEAEQVALEQQLLPEREPCSMLSLVHAPGMQQLTCTKQPYLLQALAAQQAGRDEVVRLLQQPEDLARLPELLAEYESRLKTSKAAVSSLVQSQVEAARRGIELLDKSHRHVLKLRSCMDRINQ